MTDFFDLPSSRCTSYTLINIIAAFVHLVNFIVTIIIGDERIYPIYETFADWHAVTDAVTDADAADACPISCPTGAYSFGNNTVIVNPLAKKSTYSLSLLWLIAAFHLLSFVFQFGVSLRCSGYDYNDKIQRGINPARFVEYSISATLMLVCIALVSGITEQYALLAIVTLTFTTMILGMIAELLFDDIHLPTYTSPPRFVSGDKVNANAKPAGGGNNRTVQTMRTIGWTAHFLGWVTMLAAYGGIILRNFYFSVSASVNKPPDWVQYAILSVFGLYNVFGGVQFIQLWHKMPLTVFCCVPSINIKPKHDPIFNKWIENIYVINSLVSKTLLGYLIIVNLVIDDARTPCE